MKGLITDHRRGRRTQKANQFVLEVEEIKSKALASRLIGRTVVWKTKKGEVHGKVVGAHGTRGAMIVRFPRDISGNILGCVLEILE